MAKERLRRLCKDIIAGNVDDDTRAALKSATMRYVATQYDAPEQVLKRLYHDSPLLRRAVAIVDGADREADDGETDVTKAHEHRGHSQLAGALVQHLHEALERRREAHSYTKRKDEPMTIEALQAERTEKLLAIGKSGGAVAMAKVLVADNDAHGISEHEYTQIVTEHAQRIYADKTPAAAFAKLFSDPGADAVLLRRAHALTKLSPFDLKPTMVGGPDAMHDAVNTTESSEAYQQLEAMASKLRESSPFLSSAQAFARAFEANPTLAAKAHVRPRPTTHYEFPR
jgi:hypothetical protein